MNTTPLSRQAMVLFGHGARDARWREPFDRLHARLTAALPHCAVRLAFLELMTPSLPDTLAALAAGGVTTSMWCRCSLARAGICGGTCRPCWMIAGASFRV